MWQNHPSFREAFEESIEGNTTALSVAVDDLICQPRALTPPTRRCWVVTEPCHPLSSSSTRGAAWAVVGPNAPSAIHRCKKGFLPDEQFSRISDLTTAVEVAPLVLGIISWARFSIRRGWWVVTGSLSGHETSWGNNDIYKDETWGTTRLDQENKILGKQDKMIRAGLSITSTLLTARPVVRPSAPLSVCGWGKFSVQTQRKVKRKQNNRYLPNVVFVFIPMVSFCSIAEGKKRTIDPTPAPATTISNEATMQIMRGVLCILHFGCWFFSGVLKS